MLSDNNKMSPKLNNIFHSLLADIKKSMTDTIRDNVDKNSILNMAGRSVNWKIICCLVNLNIIRPSNSIPRYIFKKMFEYLHQEIYT